MKKANTPLQECQPTNLQGYFTKNSGNSAGAQRQRLLAALRDVSATTIDIRRDLDILHPCGRVLELRRQGHNIQMEWVYQVTEQGERHRVGRYTLQPGIWIGAKK